MKKIIIFIVLFVFMFLCIKSALNLGEKETIVDVLNTETNNHSDVNINENLNQNSYYTSIDPIKVQYTYLTEKVSNQKMFILNSESNLENEIIVDLIKKHNFEKDTLLLVSSDYEIKSYKENKLKKDNIDISLIKGEKKESTVIIKLQNVKINSLTNINIHFEEEK